MGKKGISPLIATVLLIGFAIVLAALVFRWGGQFFSSQTEQTDQEVREVLAFAGIDISLEEARGPGCDNLSLLITNFEDVDILRFLVRITDGDEIDLITTTDGIPAFYSDWVDVDYLGDVTTITKIEIFPVIELDGEEIRSTEPAYTGIFEAGDIVVLNCTELICDDGLDNDGNEGTDCDDPDCQFVGTELVCDDFLDNDCDLLPDCADPDCTSGLEILCHDNLDDNCNLLIDCADPDCVGGTETNCYDGIDDDCDGDIDCDDSECIDPDSDINTVLLYRFNEGAGNFICDSSGNGNNGILGNGVCVPGIEPCPAWVPKGGGYELDFLDDETHVNVSHTGNFDLEFSEMTIEAQLTYGYASYRMGIIDKRSSSNFEGFYLEKGNYGSYMPPPGWRFDLGNGSEIKNYYCFPSEGASYFVTGKTYNLSIVYDSSLPSDNLKMYDQDGQICASGASLVGFGSIKIPSEDMIIGHEQYGAVTYNRWGGLIDNLEISNIAETF
ncbi:MAG: hypothetical protein KKH88_02750 [Nanoarchaeota archaeon]|nr:hypothetical protein [Nanoarchaeota archaeon]